MATLTYVDVQREPGKPHNLSITSIEMNGWIPLPDELRTQFYACEGYCNLVITDGVITALEPDENDPRPYYEQKRTAEEAIKAAKAQLAESDYKVLKAYEASIIGKEAPYDMAEVIAARDALRADVNAAEASIAEADASLSDYFTAANAARSSWH